MNSSRDLIKRLLHLFPIKQVKDYFGENGSADDVIEEISANQTGPAIKTFCRTSYLYTKQNIYLFKLNRNFTDDLKSEDFPYSVESKVVNGNESIFYFFPKTTYTVYLSNPTEKEDLKFLRPVVVRISGRSLIIHITKLIKNEKNYWSEERFPKRAEIETDELDILYELLAFIGNEYKVSELDINKGVKHIWEIDDVDCVKIHWREKHSIDSATMDETLTFKENYPARYSDIVLTPLGKTNFIYLKDDEYLCKDFTVDPTSGHISITSSPKFPNQVTNVVSKILANN